VKSKNGVMKKTVVSKGVRQRLGRPVVDATDSINMPLTATDITAAAKRRMGYDVDDPENFGECVLATCVEKAVGSEVLIMRFSRCEA
jgi:hypothetical protein